MKPKLTAERLREVLTYDAETGTFTWRVQVGNRGRIGNRAGHRDARGYWRIQVDGKSMLAHRAAWLYMTGDLPDVLIDHRNCDLSDNRFKNLRVADAAVNAQNRRRGHGASGVLGVSRRPDCDRWHARIYVGGRLKYLGLFKTSELAHEAYVNAKRELHQGCTL